MSSRHRVQLALALAPVLTLLTLSSTARASDPATQKTMALHLEYLDILGAELVGETASRRYDLGSGSRHLGTLVASDGSQLLGAGLGLRAVFAALSGVRLGVEASYTAGRFRDGTTALPEPGVVARAEMLGSVGVEGTIAEILTLHTATVMGFDFQEFDVRPNLLQAASIVDAAPAPTMTSDGKPVPLSSMKLSDTALRLGQQIGFHVQIATMVALYGDGTFDYDGQWRVRLGVSIGRPVTKKTVDDEEGGFRRRRRS